MQIVLALQRLAKWTKNKKLVSCVRTPQGTSNEDESYFINEQPNEKLNTNIIANDQSNHHTLDFDYFSIPRLNTNSINLISVSASSIATSTTSISISSSANSSVETNKTTLYASCQLSYKTVPNASELSHCSTLHRCQICEFLRGMWFLIFILQVIELYFSNFCFFLKNLEDGDSFNIFDIILMPIIFVCQCVEILKNLENSLSEIYFSNDSLEKLSQITSKLYECKNFGFDFILK